MAKDGTRAFDYLDLQKCWETEISPLFSEDELVQQTLVNLDDDQIVPKLNHVLHQIEDTRRPDFQGDRVANRRHGMLIEDMRKRASALSPRSHGLGSHPNLEF